MLSSGAHTWPSSSPLQTLPQLPPPWYIYSTRRIGRSKSVGAGYVPDQQPPTLPGDLSDAIRMFPICAIEARWFQVGWVFLLHESPVYNVVQCGMTVMPALAPTTVKPVCGETVHLQTAMMAIMRSA